MVEMNNTSVGIAVGIGIVVLLAFVFTSIFQPIEARDNPTIIEVRTGGGGNSSSAVESVIAGIAILVNQTIGNVLVTNDGVWNNIAGTGISVNQTNHNVLITNTSPDNTVCANVGTGKEIYKDGECNFKTLVGSADISITNTSNTVVIDYNGTAVTSVDGTSPIVSSGGTTPTISCPTCITTSDTWVLLDTSSPTNGTTSWTSNTFSAKKYLRLEIEVQGYNTTVTAGNLGVRFNGDSGARYSYHIDNRGSLSSQTSVGQCAIIAVDERFMYYGTIEVLSQTNKPKVFVSSISSSNHASQNGQGYFNTYCGWDNSTAQITTITLLRTSGTYGLDSTSVMKIWGHD